MSGSNSLWQLQPIFGSLPLVLALALGLCLLLIWGPGFGQLSTGRRRTLALLRACLIILLTLAMLRPTLVTTEKRIRTSHVIVLADYSRSMKYRDGRSGGTRWEELRRTIDQLSGPLADMGEHFVAQLIGFDRELHPADAMAVPNEPLGQQTDIGKALQKTAQQHVGHRVAAMILLSDGAQRALAPQATPQQAARQLFRRGIPLYTVTLGQSLDQSQARDVAIENMQDEYSVYVNNEFALRVGVRIQGYAHQGIPVHLHVETPDGEREQVATVQATATRDNQVVMVDFTYRPELAGQHRLVVEADAQVGEIADNNRMTAFLKVRAGGIRVLMLTANVLHPEPKFIRRALDESPDVEVSKVNFGLQQQSEWPLDLKTSPTIEQLEKYDVFIIGDLDANALLPDNWSDIAELVRDGRGLLMYGGYHSFAPGGYADTALAEVLPIRMQSLHREPSPTSTQRDDRHLPGPLQMLPDEPSSLTHLASGAGNQQAWRELPALNGANRLGEPKDRSRVLAKTAQGAPLLVQSVAARTLALATDQTYLWAMGGKQQQHRKFWRQLVLWLAQREKQQESAIFIDLPQRRFQAGQGVAVRAGLTDEVGDLVTDVPLRATVTRLAEGDSSTDTGAGDGVGNGRGQSMIVPLQSTPDGWTGTVGELDQPGLYRVQVQVADGFGAPSQGGSSPKPATADFVVVKRDYELSDPAANPGLMQQLASATSEVGGRVLAAEQLPALLAELKAAPSRDDVESEQKWQLGDTPRDAWACFLTLVSLLSIEWFLRKRWGLV